MATHKVEQLIIATVGFFWCFLVVFNRRIQPQHRGQLPPQHQGASASSRVRRFGWLRLAESSPDGPPTASERRALSPCILAGCGLISIASAFTTDYRLLFVERVLVAVAGVSFVVGIQHVAQWFDEHEIGTAEGLYAGTGNVGAGAGALVLPRLFGTNYHGAFLSLGVIALFIAAWYLWRGKAAKTTQQVKLVRGKSDLRGTLLSGAATSPLRSCSPTQCPSAWKSR